jgi:protein SCO1/2
MIMKQLSWRWHWRLAVGLVAALLAGCSSILPAARPAVLWDAPTFTLTDSAGQSFSSTDLSGRVWMVDFMYTHCTDICPTYLSPKMQALQERILKDKLGNQAALVTITVDPQRDTPAVLADYAHHFAADPSVWHFLTGPKPTTDTLMQTGFKVGSAINAETVTVTTTATLSTTASISGTAQADPPGTAGAGNYTLIHTPYFLLVDRQGKVRSTFDATTVSVDQMYAVMRALTAEK